MPKILSRDGGMTTIRDVAREAKVSIATISRVFNGSARVSDETSARVREAAARLGYWPNGAARSLITRRTHALGVLLPDLYGEFFSEVIRGVDLASRGAGYHLMVSSSHADTDELMSALQSMRGRIDGLAVMAPDAQTPAALRDVATHMPVVLLNPAVPVRRSHTLSIANFEGASSLVRHLLGLGHTRIAFVRGPERNIDAEQRLLGWRSALREAGIEPGTDLEAQGDFTESSGFEAARDLLARTPRPTAIFAANDYMAVGVIGALREAGLRVPEDIAVAGFDDIAIARYLDPPLTTVRVESFRLGQRGMELLLEALKPGASDGTMRHEVLPTTVVVRRSCGADLGHGPPATARGRPRSADS